ncbi:MAG: hypothetical protein GQ532_08995, partial [Methylomarinum sp.]|nr:hypothetical protein [Methylomarinum sp.]
MLLLSIGLFWLPIIGPLIAGVVGGNKAGGVVAAIIAVFLPAFIVGSGFFVFASILSGFPVLGVVAGLGGLTMA